MEHKGFLASLFDMSFSSLVTTKVIKLIYILSMVAIALLALTFVAAAFKANAGLGLLTLLVLAPIGSLIYLTYARVFLELIIALFRIMENTNELVRLGRSEHGESADGGAPRFEVPRAGQPLPGSEPPPKA